MYVSAHCMAYRFGQPFAALEHDEATAISWESHPEETIGWVVIDTGVKQETLDKDSIRVIRSGTCACHHAAQWLPTPILPLRMCLASSFAYMDWRLDGTMTACCCMSLAMHVAAFF
jgi:hypothetical protein